MKQTELIAHIKKKIKKQNMSDLLKPSNINKNLILNSVQNKVLFCTFLL
jgi:hypothetical protein